MPAEIAVYSMSMLASVLSMAASTKSLMRRQNVSASDALKIVESRAKPQDKAFLQRDDIRTAILEITIIADDLLKQLAGEAKACQKRHIKDRHLADASGNQTAKDQADIDAAQCMCRVLRDIKRYNKGRLPEGPFLHWWDSYGCKA